MARFWIYYSTSVCIEAETQEEAINQFLAGDESNEVGCTGISINEVEEEEY